MSGRTTSHRTTNGLYSGTHYWLVGTRNRDFEQRFSRVGRFRVSTTLAVGRVRVTPGATAGTGDVRMRLKPTRGRCGSPSRCARAAASCSPSGARHRC